VRREATQFAVVVTNQNEVGPDWIALAATANWVAPLPLSSDELRSVEMK